MAVFFPLNERSWEAVFFDSEQFGSTLESNRQLSLPSPMGSPVDPGRCKPSASHKSRLRREVVKALRLQFVTAQLRPWYETSLSRDNIRRCRQGHSARHSWFVHHLPQMKHWSADSPLSHALMPCFRHRVIQFFLRFSFGQKCAS